MTALELRNYLLKPNTLDQFIDYFEEHFIASQEMLNMQVLGQFRLMRQPNRFVWLRSFSDMPSRLDSLNKFYNGPIWEKYGPAANDMMLEWHNVHLLRPITDITNLTRGLSAETVADDLANNGLSPETGLIVVDIFQAKPGRRDTLIKNVKSKVLPIYQKLDIEVRGLFVAQMAPNEFTRLPVIQNENELVVITAYEHINVFWTKCELMSHATDVATVGLISAERETLMLNPTLRSPVRYRS